MRKKTEALVISFGTTTEAMKMERHCEKEGLPGRLPQAAVWPGRQSPERRSCCSRQCFGRLFGGRVCIPWSYEKQVRIYLSQMRRNMYE